MGDCFIYDALRTPRGKGKAGGALNGVPAVELISQVLRALRDRNSLDTCLVEEVILGCVTPVFEQGGNIARIAALNAEYDQSVPGVQINRYCASGLEAVNMAAAQVMCGQSRLVIAGGIESMSRVPMGADGNSWSTNPTVARKTAYIPQGVSADAIATMYGFSRRDLDAYSAESHRRAENAWGNGYFSNSVVPVKDILGLPLLVRDETIRPETTVESLAGLKPSFVTAGEQLGYDEILKMRYPQIDKVKHLHHAGNSSGIVDGAAAVLLGTQEMGAILGMRPRARIKAFGSIGTEPCIMLTGPEAITRRLFGRHGMKVDDIDIYEMNEAFASAVLRYMMALNIPHDKININGGAIAMGHPLGATGAMLVGTVLDELERSGKGVGLITLCVGAGMGIAAIIERI